MIKIKTKDPLVKKYLFPKDELVSELHRPLQIARPGVSVIRTPASKDTPFWCPTCIRVQEQFRMFYNKSDLLECSGCHATVDPDDLGLKPYTEDHIVAANDPYKPTARIYTPSKKLLQDFGSNQTLKKKQEGVYVMFKREKFDTMIEAMTAGLNPPKPKFKSANL